MRAEVCIDKEGNTDIRDIFFKCPICKDKYETYEGAKNCFILCAEEEHGQIEEVVEDIEEEYIED